MFRYDKIVVRRTVSQSVVKNHYLSNVTVDDRSLFYPSVQELLHDNPQMSRRSVHCMYSYGFIMVFQIEGGTQAEGACDKGADEFGPKVEEVTRDWGRLHTDERHDV